MHDLHTCANCHSFSADGKTMGMDVDGPGNDKGLYAIVPVQKHDDYSQRGHGCAGTPTCAWASRASASCRRFRRTASMCCRLSPGPGRTVPDSYFVTNFKDYRFLQVFYPTRGILAYYDRATGRRQPLPGADDPQLCADGWRVEPGWQVGGVCARGGEGSAPAGERAPVEANDPNESADPVQPVPRAFQRGQRRQGRADCRRLEQRDEQQLPQGFSGRALDCFCEEPERAADAARQRVVYRAGRRAARPGACAAIRR